MITLTYRSRPQWNARPPTAVLRLDWSRVTRFIVHYSGASRLQSVRSIQDYCMDDKGHSDIDYNELVRGSTVYQGRGDNVGGHTGGLNSTSYGVCMVGLDGDATDEDFFALRTRYEYACGRAERRLEMHGHRSAPGQNTSCPGDELMNWIAAGMPWPTTPEDTDVKVIMICEDGEGQLLAADGMESRYITRDDVGHMKTLETEGLYKLLNADNPRKGWYPGAYGPIRAAGEPGKDGRTPTEVALEISGVEVPAKVTEWAP